MNWEDELKGYVDWAHNFDLEDTENERRGDERTLCLQYPDVVTFIKSLLKKQKEICSDIAIRIMNENLQMPELKPTLALERYIKNAPEPIKL